MTVELRYHDIGDRKEELDKMEREEESGLQNTKTKSERGINETA